MDEELRQAVWDPRRHNLPPAVREQLDHVYVMLDGMVDPDNRPSAVFPFVVEAVTKLCFLCIDAEAEDAES